MTEWKTRIGYLPRDLVDEAKVIVIDKVWDESVQYDLFRLLERAFSAGYEAAYIRCQIEGSWREFRAKQAAKEQSDGSVADELG